MSFSYDPSMLETNPVYQMRLRMGDTDKETHQFEDEELNFFLKENNGQVLTSCIAGITALLPRLSASTGFTVGPYTERGSSSTYAYWSRLLQELRAEASVYSAPIAHLPQTPSYFYFGMMGTPGSSATDP